MAVRPLVALALILAACGPAQTVAPSPTASPPPTPLATACCPPTASPVVSAKGLIVLRSPTADASLTSPVTISGEASVFEASLAWRITDTAGRVIAEGHTTASAGAPAIGTFSIIAPFTVPSQTLAFIEVFDRNPKDGSVDEIVRIPVTLR
jgi:immunoglobulin-like protein involved in spore germination